MSISAKKIRIGVASDDEADEEDYENDDEGIELHVWCSMDGHQIGIELNGNEAVDSNTALEIADGLRRLVAWTHTKAGMKKIHAMAEREADLMGNAR